MRHYLGITEWSDRDDPQKSLVFVSEQLRSVFEGVSSTNSNPPATSLICSHLSHDSSNRSIKGLATRHFLHCGRGKAVSRYVANAYPHIPSTFRPFIFPLYHPFALDVIVFWDIPSQQRSGHLLVTMTLGAGHSALRDVLSQAEKSQSKRSMYAETRREKDSLLETLQGSEWNAEMDPIVVTLKGTATFHHDFTKGSFCTQVEFDLRNYSLTHPSRFVFRLSGPKDEIPSQPPSPHLLPPRYSGRLTFRGTIRPTEVATLKPTVLISRPGSYSLAGWCVETEVGEDITGDNTGWRTRHRYVQTSTAGDLSCITVCDVHSTIA